MEKVCPSQETIRFGGFEVDLRIGEVRKHGFKIRLQDQPFHVLQILLEHPRELVAREELQRQIWPADTFVDFEKGLNNAIKRLRDALGDSAEQPRFIETHSRRGYRFIGSITAGNGAGRTEEGSPTGEIGVPARPLYRRLAIGAVLFLAFVATLFGLDVGGVRHRWMIRAGSPAIHSLAVLPLANLSNDPNQEYLSDGMTDALITDLAQVGSLKVISRTSSMQYKQTKKSLPEIARELNVDGIVEGTVQRSGDRVRITAQLIHGRSDKHLWANSYERDLRDIFTFEREVTDDIAHQIRARIATENQVRVPQRRPVNLEALEAYLQGSYHLNKADTAPRDQELRKAGEFFQHAIDAQPDFAPAYIGLAEAHDTLWWPSSEDFALMRGAAQKAVGLDPTSSDARNELAFTKAQDWDWSGAEEEYRRAITLNANNALAHDQLGDCLDTMGRLEEGWKEHELAQELDPNQDHLSEPLYRRGEYDAAIGLLLKSVESRPEDAIVRWRLSQNYIQKGMYKEWVQQLGKMMTLFGLPDITTRLEHAFVRSGDQGALLEWARDVEQLMVRKQGYFPGVLAQVYARLGEKDQAFYWLEEGSDHRRLAIADPVQPFVKVDPGFASLRSDARFEDLLRRMGLPK
jgi:TolB-like protein/DNA-binding winged helix-turn-helix (wHTH) protein